MADSLLLDLDTNTGVNLASCDDASLARALREGSEPAYEMLVSRFQQPVYSLIFRLLAEPSDAADVVQEVFLKVFRNIGSFRGQSGLKTWIYRIAVNEAYNYRRWFFRHRRQEVVLEDGVTGGFNDCETLRDGGKSPYDQAVNREKHLMIEKALSRINPSFRAAVVLRDVEELSYEEIADVLDISLGTVKSRILRGREAMRRELEGRLAPESVLQWSAQPAE